MKAEELINLEQRLQEAGYKRYTNCTSSIEDYGYFKCKKDGETLLWTISYRIWSFSKYEHRDEYIKANPYSVDVLIIDGDSSERIDVVFTLPVPDIEQAEKFADDFHQLVTKSKLKSII